MGGIAGAGSGVAMAAIGGLGGIGIAGGIGACVCAGFGMDDVNMGAGAGIDEGAGGIDIFNDGAAGAGGFGGTGGIAAAGIFTVVTSIGAGREVDVVVDFTTGVEGAALVISVTVLVVVDDAATGFGVAGALNSV